MKSLKGHLYALKILGISALIGLAAFLIFKYLSATMIVIGLLTVSFFYIYKLLYEIGKTEQ